MLSKQAYIHPDAKLGKNVTVETFAYIAGYGVIGDDCWIGPGAVIHDGARIGKGCKIHTVEEERTDTWLLSAATIAMIALPIIALSRERIEDCLLYTSRCV